MKLHINKVFLTGSTERQILICEMNLTSKHTKGISGFCFSGM
ncbi:unnamed protein product [Acanthoscelides obtectus]|uniref:Uncharacterized protein n=1 Tax=Acanthoscelides obtectus TaxID=200917 RepID=A0A9P0JKE3_ACAOB|nr:unnamed protein product [Acanthoscelides obtectus]CAK1661074.1 hypothetical protein AOBTE_LOCUS22421 [Acanthoscelides obtectus]